MRYLVSVNAALAGKLASTGGALRNRIFSAAVLVTAVLLATAMGGLAFLALVLIFTGLLHREWFRVPDPSRYPASIGLLVACWGAAVLWHLVSAQAAITAALVCGLVGLVVALRGGNRLILAVTGYAYIALPALVFLHLRESGIELLVFVFVVVWLTDTGAYFVGRMIGGPKLWRAVSPNKTWSGAAGGLVVGCAAGVVAAWAYGVAPDRLAHVMLIGIIVSIAGQIGDLAESAWKRHFNVKDSGSIIPGHGGVMDRLDSLILAAPVLALVQATGGASF